MGILDGPLINDLKPIKPKGPKTERFEFDKSKPLGPYNFPLFAYAKYRITGYRTDAAGIRHPVEWEETLPCNQQIRLTHPDDITVTSCIRAVGGPILK